jgi:O-antigen/teichoic acid export membrane protein
MLSDIGVGPLLISSRRDDDTFINTLWTAKVARGIALAGVIAVVAFPAAWWFHEPRLKGLIGFVAVAMVIRSFSHVSEFTLTRDLRQREATIIDVSSQLISLIALAVLAYIFRNVWALAIGGLFGDCLRTAISFYVGRDRKHRFTWDPEALNSLRGFGRWVFFSSILTYVMMQGDRLVFGSLMSLQMLGNYQIAITLAGAVETLLGRVAGTVLFPLYSLIGKETTPEFRARVRRLRWLSAAATLPPLCVLVGFGDFVVGLLWDARYSEARWMVRVLALGSIGQELGRIGPIHLARGESWIGVVSEGVRVVTLLIGLSIGYKLAGPVGLIGGMAVALFAEYPVTVWSTRRYGLWVPEVDATAAAAAATMIGIFEFARHFFGLGW